MSLSSHLEQPGSEVRRFFYDKFPYTRGFVREQNKKLPGAHTILPTEGTPYLRDVRPADKIPYPYSDIGTAIDYRIRYYFVITPYMELVAYRGALILGRYYQRLPISLIDEFFDSLLSLLIQIGPTNRRLPHHEEEQLNRYCFILSLLEQAHRIPRSRLDRSLLFVGGNRTSLSDLLSIPETQWLQDMCSLSWLFYDQYRQQLSDITAVMNPTFLGSTDIGGADADLIMDNCLIDIKTEMDPKVWNRIPYQLLGYTLLDYEDRYQLNEVGIYFARQGVRLTWTIEHLIDTLSARKQRNRLPNLREQFREIVTVTGDRAERERRVAGQLRAMGIEPLIPPEWIQ